MGQNRTVSDLACMISRFSLGVYAQSSTPTRFEVRHTSSKEDGNDAWSLGIDICTGSRPLLDMTKSVEMLTVWSPKHPSAFLGSDPRHGLDVVVTSRFSLVKNCR